jgi:2',3'-cyclic-nucleotide 2'-phosphodiesterase (5'-nucleotidase family)
LQEVVASSTADLVINDPVARMKDGSPVRIIRNAETNLGDLCADAYLNQAVDADIAFVAGGGIRASIEKGNVTLHEILRTLPFNDYLTVIRVTGQQILDALEFGAKETQSITSFDGNPVGEFGGFMQVSGLKYTIDTSIESGVIVDENGMMTGIEGKRRVSDVMILKGGEYVPLDPAAEYTVASLDYALFNGGDGHTAFKDCERIVESGPMDVQSLIEYCRHLGTIPDSYRNTEERITVK